MNGAGFSADSGLAVYADVAKAHQFIRLHMNLWTWCVGGTFVECLYLEVPAYRDRKLTYQDVCQPHWLFEEPDLFWGFWGQCTELRNWELGSLTGKPHFPQWFHFGRMTRRGIQEIASRFQLLLISHFRTNENNLLPIPHHFPTFRAVFRAELH